LVRQLAGGTAGQLAGSEPCDEGGLGPLSDPMGRNKVKPEQASKVLMRMPTLRSLARLITSLVLVGINPGQKTVMKSATDISSNKPERDTPASSP
jgi:hypothetical protein